ncbi:hypothetical protein ACGFZR_09800 [Streptomyces sp. NPDC048241]
MSRGGLGGVLARARSGALVRHTAVFAVTALGAGIGTGPPGWW